MKLLTTRYYSSRYSQAIACMSDLTVEMTSERSNFYRDFQRFLEFFKSGVTVDVPYPPAAAVFEEH